MSQKALQQVQTALAGRFRVVREIGHGGMARVYEAIPDGGDQRVALKVLRPELVSLVERRRFLREIDILSSLAHAHILRILSSGETEDSLFYTMPLLDGGTLRDRLARETQLPLADALRVARAIGSALDYAAAQQIVHRDVKPANILFGDDGVPVLADFGIARAIQQSAGDRLTYSQFAIGTPLYMSPEQHAPSSNLDGRSDQYSLAIVTYELLAGTPPFGGATPAVIMARKSLEPMPSLRAIRREIPENVERSLARALAVTPADRFSSATEFVDAMSAPAPRRRAMTAVAGGVALVAVLGGLWWRAAPAAPAAQRRVAVLPFQNTTGDTSLGVIGLMAADWIAEGLSRTGVVSVVPTPSVLDAAASASPGGPRGGADTESRLGRSLGAGLLVTGRVYIVRDSIVLNAQVGDAQKNQLLGTLQAATTDRRDPMKAISELRTRVMGLLASELDANLAATAGPSVTPPTFEAYRSFTRGLEEYSRNDFSAASRLFLDGFREDSTFAVPLLFASISLSNLGKYATADSVAQRMERLANTLSPLHRTWLEYRLRLLSGNRAAALQTVRRLAALSPGTKATYNYAVEAYENGYYDEAIAALRTLDTNNGPMRAWASWWDVMGSSQHLLGDFAAEENTGKESRRRFPDRLFAVLPTVRALAALGRFEELDQVLVASASRPIDPYGTTVASLTFEAGREALAHHGPAAARTLLERARDLYLAQSPIDSSMLGDIHHLLAEDDRARAYLEPRLERLDASTLGILGSAQALVGDWVAATSTIERLSADVRPYQFGEARLAAARVRAALGDSEAAFALLSDAFREGMPHDHWIHTMPDLRRLRAEPRFRELTGARR